MAAAKRDEGLLLVVSGPSGVGKGTICRALLERRRDLKLSVSATTRQPRAGEREGVNYYFKTREEFERMLEGGEFLESFEIYGNRYGTPKKPVFDALKKGVNVVLEIDMQGGMAVKKAFPRAVMIFILPPSAADLAARLKGRNSESEDSLKTRTEAAAKEIEKCKFYDYVVLNDSVSNAVCAIINIIEAESLRPGRNAALIRRILGGNAL